MPKELSSENQEATDIIDVKDVVDANSKEGESSEETEQQTSEPSKVQEEPEVTPQEEYTKERFNGLMSSWQRDRTELTEAKRKLGELESSQKPVAHKDDELVDYLHNKIREKETAERRTQDEAVQKELDEVMATSSGYTKDEILKTAIKYSRNADNPVSLKTAVLILNDIKASKGLVDDEASRKKTAGTIAGRSGYQTSAGVRPYDSEKDKGKSYNELIDEGKEELGIK